MPEPTPSPAAPPADPPAADDVAPTACLPPRSARLVAAQGTPEGLDAEVLELLLSVMESVKDDLFAVAASEQLTPPQSFLLRLLEEPRPMGELAELLGYDASNITAIADKLEARGLLERQVDATDRRVKRLALTSDGRELRGRLDRRLHAQATVVARLDDDQKAQLRDLLRAAVDG